MLTVRVTEEQLPIKAVRLTATHLLMPLAPGLPL